MGGGEQQSKDIAHFKKHTGLTSHHARDKAYQDFGYLLTQLLQKCQLRLFSETKHVLFTQPLQFFLPQS